MSLNTAHTSCLLACLLATTLDLTHALPTLPIFKATNSALRNTGLDSPSLLGVPTAQTHVSSITIHSPEAPDDKPRKGDGTAALIGGTVATAVILIAIVFVAFAIYKQYVIQQACLKQQALQDDYTLHTTPEGEDKKPSAFLQRVSCFFRRPVSYALSDSDCESVSSTASPSTHSIAAETGAREHLHSELVLPAKAAKVLGLGDRAWRPRRDSNPPPPLNTVLEEHASTRSYRRGSGCTMSTLGMDLLRDTMQTPQPQKFCSPPTPQTPWQPRHEGGPVQDPDPSQRYFIPMLSPSSPESPHAVSRFVEMERQEPEVARVVRRVERESGLKRTYSMGDNKF